MNVLFTSAHADDIEGHAGGLLIKLVDAGHKVASILTTAGKSGEQIRGQLARTVRIQESAQSHGILGVELLPLLRQEEEYGVTPYSQMEFDKIVERIQPDVVITHWPIDVHWDHRVCSVLTMNSCLKRGVNVELLFFEPNSSGRSSDEFRPQSVAFFPTHYVDVSDPQLLERKRQLLWCHASQHPEGMWRGQLNSQLNRGREAGVEQAEGYVRATRCGKLHPDLVAILCPTPFHMPRPIGVDFRPEAIGISV